MTTNGDIQAVLDPQFVPDPDYIRQLAETKRVVELWCADHQNQELLRSQPETILAQYNLHLDAQELSFLWDKNAKHDDLPLCAKRYAAFMQEKLAFRTRLQQRDCEPAEKNFKVWRQRQMKRSASELGRILHDVMIYTPVILELSKGCSVGCWFCAFGAPPLQDVFLYTPTHRQLWHDVLEALGRVIGPAAGFGVCYWATEPLDNPDYEKFLGDFHGIFGVFPQTTTALSLKDPQRTRALLALSRSKGGVIERFSILSLALFRKVLRTFTPEELLFTELLPHYQESPLLVTANAGRARAKVVEQQQRSVGTIACATGFKINMVARSVELIAPCAATDRWPLGYWSYDVRTFADAGELEAVLWTMIRTYMPPTLRYADRIRFREDLRYERTPDGFTVHSPYKTLAFRAIPHLDEIGDLIQAGAMSAGDIALWGEAKYQAPLENTFYTLNYLFAQGILAEEPHNDLAPSGSVQSGAGEEGVCAQR